MRELSLLEEQDKLWRKQCEERVKCMEEYYEQQLARIDEEYEKAVLKIEMEYRARKNAVLRQNNGCKISGDTVEKPIPASDKIQPPNDCTRTKPPFQIIADSPKQSPPTKSVPKQSFVSTSIRRADDPESTSCQTNEVIIKIASTADSKNSNLFAGTRAQALSTCKLLEQEKTMTMRIVSENELKRTTSHQSISASCNTPAVCAKYDGSDQVVIRVESSFEKQCEYHHSVSLPFDPGGYCKEKTFQCVAPFRKQSEIESWSRASYPFVDKFSL